MYGLYVCNNCNYIIIPNNNFKTLFSRGACFNCGHTLTGHSINFVQYKKEYNLYEYCCDKEVTITISSIVISNKIPYAETCKYIDLNIKSASELLKIKDVLDLIL